MSMLKLSLLAFVVAAEEQVLLQSKVVLSNDDVPKQFDLVERVTFAASTWLMSLAVVYFARWASQEAGPEKPDSASAPQSTEDAFSQLLDAVKLGDECQCEELLQKQPNLAMRCDAWSATALHVAASCGFSVIVQLLLQAGAAVNARDGSEDTPLHVAAAAGELCGIIALIDSGADVDAKNSSGGTPLMLASKAGEKAACEILLEHGATPLEEQECCGLPPKGLSWASTTDGTTTASSSPCSPSLFDVTPFGDGAEDLLESDELFNQ